jgi:hypothetical protein
MNKTKKIVLKYDLYESFETEHFVEISGFTICGLIIKIYGFVIAEWDQEFADLRFADL